MSSADSKEFTSYCVTPPEKVCMVSESRKIQMQKGELTRALNISQVPNRGLAPKEFSYWRYEKNLFGKYLLELCPENVVCEDGEKSYPLSGYYQIRWCTTWIPYKGIGMWFHSKQDYLKIKQELMMEYNNKTMQVLNKMYEMDSYGRWNHSTTYRNQSDFKLIGYDGYFKKIEQDIYNHKIHADILKLLGETKSINYLLYGPPGTGKTTLIRSLASKYNYPVCVVNPNILRAHTISLALNPVLPNINNDNDTCIFVIFEDFDRFIENTNDTTNTSTLSEQTNQVMSQILNSLDGFGDNSNVVRFFTGNDYSKIRTNEALLNRMSCRFEFTYPNTQLFVDKLDSLLTVKNPDEICVKKRDEFITHAASIKNLTLRPFTNYVIRYLFCDNFMDKLLENIGELST